MAKKEKRHRSTMTPAGNGHIGSVAMMSAREARDNFAVLLNGARYQGKRTIITQHGKPAAILKPIEEQEEYVVEYGSVKELFASARRGEDHNNARRERRRPAVPKLRLASSRKDPTP